MSCFNNFWYKMKSHFYIMLQLKDLRYSLRQILVIPVIFPVMHSTVTWECLLSPGHCQYIDSKPKTLISPPKSHMLVLLQRGLPCGITVQNRSCYNPDFLAYCWQYPDILPQNIALKQSSSLCPVLENFMSLQDNS